jgi:hypothetical protein
VSIFEETFFSQKWSFWIKCPGQTFCLSISKVIFFLFRLYETRQTSTNIQLLDFNFWKNLQNTEKFRLFWPCFRPLRPRRGHPHSKFWKVVEQKLFLVNVRNFLVCSSFCFLHISISLHPTTLCIKITAGQFTVERNHACRCRTGQVYGYHLESRSQHFLHRQSWNKK